MSDTPKDFVLHNFPYQTLSKRKDKPRLHIIKYSKLGEDGHPVPLPVEKQMMCHCGPKLMRFEEGRWVQVVGE